MEERVLVIEDDLLTGKLHSNIVESARFSSVLVENFEQALNEIGSGVFAVITDDEIPVNSQTKRAQPHAEKIIDVCLEKGIPQERILVVSATMKDNKKGILFVKKGFHSFSQVKDFLCSLSKKEAV